MSCPPAGLPTRKDPHSISLIAVGGAVFNLNLQQALRDVQAADRDKTEKLWQAYLERARALRSSGLVGQRFETLKVIREAAKIKVTPELRDEAVAALVLPDVELAREWEGYPAGTFNVAPDATFQRFVRIVNLAAGAEEIGGGDDGLDLRPGDIEKLLEEFLRFGKIPIATIEVRQ